MTTPERVRELAEHHRQIAVILLAGVEGSTPREAGTAMVVTPHGTEGTIGGGAVEWRAIQRAREMLERPAAAAGQSPTGLTAQGGAEEPGLPHEWLVLPLGPEIDQCCGGRMTLAIAVIDTAYLHRLHPTNPPASRCGGRPWRTGDPLPLWSGGPVLPEPAPKPQVWIYGAGHVGQALARTLVPLGFAGTLVSVRNDPDRIGDAQTGGAIAVELSALPEHSARRAPDTAAHVVMTHSHAVDLEIVAAVLARPHRFCGLIGSATKAATFRRRLAERGLPDDAIARLACPVGLPGLRDKRPEAIAVSIAAQLLADAAP